MQPAPLMGIPKGISNRLPLISSVLLAGLICLSLGQQAVTLYNTLNAPLPSAAPLSADPLPPPAPEQLQALFGQPRASQAQDSPLTTLQLTLLGSFVSPQPAESSAIIQRQDEAPRRLRVGDALGADIRLHAIYAERVELLRNGQLETHTFPRPQTPPTLTRAHALAAPAPTGDADAGAGCEDPLVLLQELRKQLQDHPETPAANPRRRATASE